MVQLTSGNAILQQRGSAMSDCHADTTGVPSYHCTIFCHIHVGFFIHFWGEVDNSFLHPPWPRAV